VNEVHTTTKRRSPVERNRLLITLTYPVSG
jgi:hypothetical protein